MSRRKREILPFMKSLADAVALSKRGNDGFYVAVFRIECWLGKLINDIVRQYADNVSATDRRLQTGEALRLLGEVFKNASNRESTALFRHLTRFAHTEGTCRRC